MRKIETALALVLLITGFAEASNFPNNYEPILDCPADERAYAFRVLRKGQIFFLEARVSSSVRIFELKIDDRDFGHMTYALVSPNDLGESSNFVKLIHIYNNEADIEDPDQAIITEGAIQANEYDGDQLCYAIGRPRVK